MGWDEGESCEGVKVRERERVVRMRVRGDVSEGDRGVGGDGYWGDGSEG